MTSQHVTPARLADETGWPVESWAAAKDALDAAHVRWWFVLWRPISEISGYSGVDPGDVARVLAGDDERPGVLRRGQS